MKLYHVTNAEAASEIMAAGFCDQTHRKSLTGVWLSNIPVGPSEGARGMQVLEVHFPDDLDLCQWERFESARDGSPYREFMVPADRVNSAARLRCLCFFCEDGEEREASQFLRMEHFQALICDECAAEHRAEGREGKVEALNEGQGK